MATPVPFSMLPGVTLPPYRRAGMRITDDPTQMWLKQELERILEQQRMGATASMMQPPPVQSPNTLPLSMLAQKPTAQPWMPGLAMPPGPKPADPRMPIPGKKPAEMRGLPPGRKPVDPREAMMAEAAAGRMLPNLAMPPGPKPAAPYITPATATRSMGPMVAPWTPQDPQQPRGPAGPVRPGPVNQPAIQPMSGVRQQDRDLLIRTVLGEAGAEPPEGQAGVAHVVLNRLKSGKFGGSIRDVVLAPAQFEPWQTKAAELQAISPDSPAYQQVAAVVDAVLAGQAPDPTGGAVNFLSPGVMAQRGASMPGWAQGPGMDIGGHRFFGGNGATAVQGQAADDWLVGNERYDPGAFEGVSPQDLISKAPFDPRPFQGMSPQDLMVNAGQGGNALAQPGAAEPIQYAQASYYPENMPQPQPASAALPALPKPIPGQQFAEPPPLDIESMLAKYMEQQKWLNISNALATAAVSQGQGENIGTSLGRAGQAASQGAGGIDPFKMFELEQLQRKYGKEAAADEWYRSQNIDPNAPPAIQQLLAEQALGLRDPKAPTTEGGMQYDPATGTWAPIPGYAEMQQSLRAPEAPLAVSPVTVQYPAGHPLAGQFQTFDSRDPNLKTALSQGAIEGKPATAGDVEYKNVTYTGPDGKPVTRMASEAEFAALAQQFPDVRLAGTDGQGAGTYAGTGMSAQNFNILLDPNADTSSPQYQAAYYQEFQVPKYVQTEQGMVPLLVPAPPGIRPPAYMAQPAAAADVPGAPVAGAVIPGTMKAPTDTEKMAAGYADRMEKAEAIIGTLENDAETPVTLWQQTLDQDVPLGNYFTTPEYQTYRQAAKDWIRSKLRKESGAVIADEEMAEEFRTYFPQPGDTPEVIRQKAAARKTAIAAMQQAAGRAYQPPAPGPQQPAPSLDLYQQYGLEPPR